MAESHLQQVIDKFNKLPKTVQQAIIGSSSGWFTGVAVVKFGRCSGFSLGATIIILQLGHQYGYINIDWKNVNRDLKKAKDEVEKQASTHIPNVTKRIQDVITSNAVTVSSFIGGFFIGASMG